MERTSGDKPHRSEIDMTTARYTEALRGHRFSRVHRQTLMHDTNQAIRHTQINQPSVSGSCLKPWAIVENPHQTHQRNQPFSNSQSQLINAAQSGSAEYATRPHIASGVVTARVLPQARTRRIQSSSENSRIRHRAHHTVQAAPSDVFHSRSLQHLVINVRTPLSERHAQESFQLTQRQQQSGCASSATHPSSSSQPQQGTIYLRSTETSTDSSSGSSNLFVALMNQNIPCLIAKNDTGYFMIGSLTAKGSESQQPTGHSHREAANSGSSIVDHVSVSSTTTGTLSNSDSTSSIICRDISMANVTSSSLLAQISPSNSTEAAVSRNNGASQFGLQTTQSDGQNVKQPDTRCTVQAERSVESFSFSGHTRTIELSPTQEQIDRDAFYGTKAHVDQLPSQRSATASSGKSFWIKTEDEDSEFVGGRFVAIQTPAQSTTPMSQTICMAGKLTNDGFFGDIKNYSNSASSSSSSCVIVLSEDEGDDLVYIGSQSPSQPCIFSASSSNVNLSATSTKQQIFTRPEKYVALSHDTLEPGAGRKSSVLLQQTIISGSGSTDTNDSVRTEQSCVMDFEGKQNKSMFEGECQPICRVASTVSLRVGVADAHTSEAKSFQQLSIEAFYRCGCGGGTCSFHSLLSSQLLMHLIEMHAQEVFFPCVHCGSKFFTSDALLQHIDKHLHIGCLSFYCSVTRCDFHANSPTTVLQHMASIHPDAMNHTCWRCSITIPTLQDFRTHITENTLQLVLCPHCSAKHTDCRCILDHIMVSHPDKGRLVAFYEILLCQERVLTGWWQFTNARESCTSNSTAQSSMSGLYRAKSLKPDLPERLASQSDHRNTEEGNFVFKQFQQSTDETEADISPVSGEIELVQCTSGGVNKKKKAAAGKFDANLSSPKSADTESTISDYGCQQLARLRKQWSNESLTNGPVIEIDRAESPSAVGLSPGDCHSSHNLSPRYVTARSDKSRSRPIQSMQRMEYMYVDHANDRSSNLKELLKRSSLHARSHGNCSGETAMSRAIKFHSSTQSKQKARLSCKSHRVRPQVRSALQDYYTTFRKGNSIHYKCLHCAYSSSSHGDKRNAYILMYQHVHREHTPYTFQCPACDYQSVDRVGIVKHIFKLHSSDSPEALSAQIVQVTKKGFLSKSALPSSSATARVFQLTLEQKSPVIHADGKSKTPSNSAESSLMPEGTSSARHASIKRVAPRDLYTYCKQGRSKFLQCLCCGHSLTVSSKKASRTSAMTIHVWNHMERFQCPYCSFRAYPSFKIKTHIKQSHCGMAIEVIDLEP